MRGVELDGAIYMAGEKAFAWANFLMAEKTVGRECMDVVKKTTLYNPIIRGALQEVIGLTGGIDTITASIGMLHTWVREGDVSITDLTRCAGAILNDGDFSCDILDISKEYGLDMEGAKQVRSFTKQAVHHMITVSALAAAVRDRDELMGKEQVFLPREYLTKERVISDIASPRQTAPLFMALGGEA